MLHRSLAELLEALSAAGDLAAISAEVDPDQELAAIVRRAAQRDGPALLFQRVRGHDEAVVANLFGSERRIAAALGIESLEEVAERLQCLGKSSGRGSWLDRLKGGGAPPLERCAPKPVRVAACQQVVKLASDVDLARLPVPRCWPDEEHRCLTAGLLLVCSEPLEEETRPPTVGRSVLPVVDQQRLAVVWDEASPYCEMFKRASAAERKLPAAVVLGGPPLLMLLDSLMLGEQVDAFALCGLLNEKPLPVVNCRTQPLAVPAEAEIVIEGYFDPDLPDVELGRFAAPTGFYDPGRSCPVLSVTAVTHRINAAFPTTVFAAPPSERSCLDALRERMLLPKLQAIWPEITDVALPKCGRGSLLTVALRRRDAHTPRRIAGGLWSLPALSHTKTIVLLEEGADVRDPAEILHRVQAFSEAGRDIVYHTGPVGLFEAAANPVGASIRLAIDATAKPSKPDGSGLPQELRPAPEIETHLEQRWNELGIDLGAD